MWKRVVLFVVAASLSAPFTYAADPSEKCESKKLKHSAVYAACRLKADAKARLKRSAADYTKCEEKFATKMAKAEEGAGLGVCPTEGDVSQVDAEIAAATTEVAEQLDAPDPACPPGYLDRTTFEVVSDHIVAYANRDWSMFDCNFHPSAFEINDQGVHQGVAAIVAAAEAELDFYGDAPGIDDIATFKGVGRTRFSLDNGFLVIEDGTDTFVVKRGQIRQQTRRAQVDLILP